MPKTASTQTDMPCAKDSRIVTVASGLYRERKTGFVCVLPDSGRAAGMRTENPQATNVSPQGNEKPMDQTETQKRRVSRLTLFLTFSRISWSRLRRAPLLARRRFVEPQPRLTYPEFVELLTLGQLLPGPNVLNLA